MSQIFKSILSDSQYKSMANSIRALTIDAIEKSQSGHPGMPLGMADFATILFSEFLNFNPKDPYWHNRDRFILSAGHGSMLLYSILYLTGYEDISIDDIKSFRQIHSKTAGHPEIGTFKAIETSTGPLGQGLANAVGIAIAERNQNSKFGDKLVDNFTYVICGDGCLMEGISWEAISLAGHLQLNKLIVIFDDNQISIDGATSIAISDNYKMKFESCNWNFINVDGHDYDQIRAALYKAQKSDKPTLIAARTIIGYSSPNKAGSASCHGSPLGSEEAKLSKKQMNWPYNAFEIPQEIMELWRTRWEKSKNKYNAWNANDLEDLNNFIQIDIPLDKMFSELKNQAKNLPAEATRKSSQKILSHLQKYISNFIGGSADLSESNCLNLSGNKSINSKDFSGNYIHYGVREHAMVAIMNGIALYKGHIPYGGTFLVFSDYCRPAIRMSALMKIKIILVMTHDSIGVGEDGPTHQPVEHLSALRAIPNLLVFRPADYVETIESWEIALKNNGPSILALSRQNLPQMRSCQQNEKNLSQRGAYILEEDENPQLILIASGSELSLALDVKRKLAQENIFTRLVSIPCLDLFLMQDKEYMDHILEKNIPRIVIEAGNQMSYDRLLSNEDMFFGVNEFGHSAPAKDVYSHFGLTVDNICLKIKKMMDKK